MIQDSNRTGIQFPGMRLNLGKTPRMMSRDIPTNHSGDPNQPTPGSVHPMPNLGSGAQRVPICRHQEGGGILKQASISNVSALMDPNRSRTKQVRPGQAAGVRFSQNAQRRNLS